MISEYTLRNLRAYFIFNEYKNIYIINTMWFQNNTIFESVKIMLGMQLVN